MSIGIVHDAATGIVREVDIDPPVFGPQPEDVPTGLDRAGVIATLNVVLGVWPLQDAANAVGVEPDGLVSEAQAWAVAQQLGGQP